MSATNLFSYIVGKLGLMIVKQNIRNKSPKEIFTKSPATVVEKKAIMWGTVNAIHRQNSKRVKNHSENRIKENLGSIPLMEDENKNIGEC